MVNSTFLPSLKPGMISMVTKRKKKLGRELLATGSERDPDQIERQRTVKRQSGWVIKSASARSGPPIYANPISPIDSRKELAKPAGVFTKMCLQSIFEFNIPGIEVDCHHYEPQCDGHIR
jgi:hypothetical protein